MVCFNLTDLVTCNIFRGFRTSSVQFAAHDDEFNKAKDRLSTLKEDPGNQVKLQIYALFKQVCIYYAVGSRLSVVERHDYHRVKEKPFFSIYLGLHLMLPNN